MRRLIKFEEISNMSIRLKKEIDNLVTYKNDLITDINSISDCYKGKDSKIGINKYLSYANNIDSFISTMEQYYNYFDWLGSSYKTTFDNFKSNIDILNKKEGIIDG